MKSVQICEGCGEEFFGIGLFCESCGSVKMRNLHRIPKFGRDTLDSKRDKTRYSVKHARKIQSIQENY